MNHKPIAAVQTRGHGKYYPGNDLPTEITDEYEISGKRHSRGDIVGLKEFEVEPISAGEKFYVPLPRWLGGDMDEQKFLIGTALKDIPVRRVCLGPYIQFNAEDAVKNMTTDGRGYRLADNLTGGQSRRQTDSTPQNHLTSVQTLAWHDARKDIPEFKRICLIKVPGMPWRFSGKGNIRQVVAYLEETQTFHEDELPYRFTEFGPSTFSYNEVTEWAYLDDGKCECASTHPALSNIPDGLKKAGNEDVEAELLDNLSSSLA